MASPGADSGYDGEGHYGDPGGLAHDGAMASLRGADGYHDDPDDGFENSGDYGGGARGYGDEDDMGYAPAPAAGYGYGRYANA